MEGYNPGELRQWKERVESGAVDEQLKAIEQRRRERRERERERERERQQQEFLRSLDRDDVELLAEGHRSVMASHTPARWGTLFETARQHGLGHKNELAEAAGAELERRRRMQAVAADGGQVEQRQVVAGVDQRTAIAAIGALAVFLLFG